MYTRRPPDAARVAMLLSLLVPSCGRSPTGGRGDPPDRTARISGATLVAAGEGVVMGTDLDLVAATLTVDGRAVVPSARSRTEIRFAMPPARACEGDGRQILITAGALSYTARLSVPSVLRMEPGESRLLSRDLLGAACLQLPAADESFVLTALNPALDEASGADPLFRVRVWTERERRWSTACSRDVSGRHALAPFSTRSPTRRSWQWHSSPSRAAGC